MIEIKGNMFLMHNVDVICITTNGVVSKGRNVMGRGCAYTAKRIFFGIDLKLGKLINDNSNIVQEILTDGNRKVFSFPTKPTKFTYDGTNGVSYLNSRFKKGKTYSGWASLSRLDIIARSAKQLVDIVDKKGFTKVVIPRPGSGAGELEWSTVRETLEDILDDRFYIITYSPGVAPVI